MQTKFKFNEWVRVNKEVPFYGGCEGQVVEFVNRPYSSEDVDTELVCDSYCVRIIDTKVWFLEKRLEKAPEYVQS